ncbi:hypothetical protein J7E99_03380 [Streptomyces sp. ISL-44]|uniref:helix-turn-helix domain-containing protein n=1 Tax=Streptomyces sp. ISL-44 TaxID=2819184 RepID=UPI001BE54F8B|nr:helix-turn-helix transcriptional regulator [Streptomyces sp. ISL-44]MBT2539770.1 hypothetical protein [Streptomyces sp. ISL-44]
MPARNGCRVGQRVVRVGQAGSGEGEGMALRRGIEEGTPAGDLAAFLVALVRGATLRELAERFGRSRSTWGNYLNGQQLLPKQLLGRLVEAYTPPGVARNTALVRASELWTAVDRERRAAAAGGGLVRQHQRRDDALQQVIKYQALVANAEKHLAELRPMLAFTQSRLENAELQLKLAGERDRARVERQLGQARERLGRVRVQQERARNRRMTSEEQQEFWMTEALTAQEEISRLEREAQDLVVPQESLEPVPPGEVDEVDDSDFESRLEHITAEGLEDEAQIEEDLPPGPSESRGEEDAQTVLLVQDVVQPVSNPVLDKPATSTDVQHQAALLASTAHVLRTASPTRIAAALGGAATSVPAAPRPSRGKRVLIGLGLLDDPDAAPHPFIEFSGRAFLEWPVLTLMVFFYSVAQNVAVRPDSNSWTGVAYATLLGLPLLYGSLRLMKMPKLPARILAVLLHATWSVLLLFDRLPWPAPDFSR